MRPLPTFPKPPRDFAVARVIGVLPTVVAGRVNCEVLSLAAPLLLAVLETVLFLVFVPGTDLLPETSGWPMAGGLVAAAWLINGAVSGLDWYRNRPVKESPATE